MWLPGFGEQDCDAGRACWQESPARQRDAQHSANPAKLGHKRTWQGLNAARCTPEAHLHPAQKKNPTTQSSERDAKRRKRKVGKALTRDQPGKGGRQIELPRSQHDVRGFISGNMEYGRHGTENKAVMPMSGTTLWKRRSIGPTS